jgi:TatD DNase family protein
LIPLEQLLIETDAPYLSPHPFRGKRNEPANVRIVADKIAELKELSVEQVAKSTTEEADKLFNWRETH